MCFRGGRGARLVKEVILITSDQFHIHLYTMFLSKDFAFRGAR